MFDSSSCLGAEIRVKQPFVIKSSEPGEFLHPFQISCKCDNRFKS
jgi:hypothetical protein